MKKMNKKGFTIVELVIVIAVIAILSAVLIPTFSGVVANAEKQAAIADAKAAYQQYVATQTLNGEEVTGDFIYKYSADKYIVIKDGQLVTDNKGDVVVYTAQESAESTVGANATMNGTSVAPNLYPAGTTTANS